MPWRSYQHPAVRDLVWLIASAPLISPEHAQDPHAYWPSAEDYLALYARHEPWLRQLDAAPQRLEAVLSQARDLRLGRYAEDLLHFWLSDPDNHEFEPVAEHVALRENGITLGELDFLVRERATGQLWHIELALKFYLGTYTSSSPELRWFGPNRSDSLARKLSHLRNKQLPLLSTAPGKAWLDAKGLSHEKPPRPWAWLKGRLFQPQALVAHPHQAQWFSVEDFQCYAENHPYQWYLLEKKHWLAPHLSTPSQHPTLMPETLLTGFLGDEAQALIGYHGSDEVVRIFVVGADWPGCISATV